MVVQVQDHEFFERDGNDLHCEIPVNFTTLALGGEVVVPGLLDEEETVTVPAGTQSGATFRVRGKGMPDVSGRGRGDLLVRVAVSVPKKLSREQRHALEQLAKALPPEKFEPTRTEQRGQGDFRPREGHLRVSLRGASTGRTSAATPDSPPPPVAT